MVKSKDLEDQAKQGEMPKEEQIGFHKGSINTLMAERNELLRIINVTEALANAHIKELEKLGVKLEEKK